MRRFVGSDGEWHDMHTNHYHPIETDGTIIPARKGARPLSMPCNCGCNGWVPDVFSATAPLLVHPEERGYPYGVRERRGVRWMREEAAAGRLRVDWGAR